MGKLVANRLALEENGSPVLDADRYDAALIPTSWNAARVESEANAWLAGRGWDAQVHVYTRSPLRLALYCGPLPAPADWWLP